jgi:hypothetical protein
VLFASAGHVGDAPVQFSAVSHTPAEERQTVLDDATESPGHTDELPVQFSATSQTLTALRHTVLDDAKSSGGQALDAPVQFSATSQTLTAPRHTVLDDANPSAGQLLFTAVAVLRDVADAYGRPTLRRALAIGRARAGAAGTGLLQIADAS